MPEGQNTPNKRKQNDTKRLVSFMIMALIFTSIINIFVGAINMRSLSQIK